MQDAAVIERPAARAPLKGGVVPYLMLDGAGAAIDFYKRAFGAEEVGERTAMPDGRLMNARIDLNGGSIMVMDPMPEHGHPAAPHNSFNLHLHVDDSDHWFERAVAAGCSVVMPMSLQFWGDRYGMVKDPYGVTWGLGTTPA